MASTTIVKGSARGRRGGLRLALASGACALAFLSAPAHADKIKNPTAIFAGLDKITGRIISFEAQVDETVQFGALQITPRVCYTRPPTEPQNTTSFIEVDEVTFNNEYRRIFGGWVFASSPGLHGIEHPIYDVWLTSCKGGKEVIPDPVDPDKVDPLKPAQPDAKVSQGQQQPRRGVVNKGDGTGGLYTPGVPAGGGQIGVAAPQGVPVAPRQPTQRFFPTNAGPGREQGAAPR
ncbi:DUF2155 domain-containing protein [Alsobacter soli]|uniref:DUF2155 domain-containing protein n=1 Tax=Alsobacter soli TaxID=2109933 RepID=A0A2T1HNN8_9HYPH|nr:DUF2155 domain-containing protein [Alsobacter soli]PSC03253.1 DUF2155 domain-containing protein [Alsobacter soli]